MNVHYLVRDGRPYLLELAFTCFTMTENATPTMCGLITVMDLNLGLITDAMLTGSTTHQFTGMLDLLNLGAEDDEGDLITLTVPDPAVLPSLDLLRLPVAAGTTVVRRSAGAPLHPAHTAAISVLLRSPDGSDAPDIEGLFARWESTLDQVGTYSLYEHTFDLPDGTTDGATDSTEGPVAVYRRPRSGDLGSEHAAHDFDPYCCGVAGMQALATWSPAEWGLQAVMRAGVQQP